MSRISVTDISVHGIGWGIGEPHTGAIAVPFSLPGDIVEPLKGGSKPTVSHQIAERVSAVEDQVFRPQVSSTTRGITPIPDFRLIQSSPYRQASPCSAFPHCSGCTFMHAKANWQIEFKERLVRDLVGDLAYSAEWDPPLQGETEQYRRKARLRARWDAKSSTQFIGFKNRFGRFIADVTECAILAPPFDTLITPLRALLGSLSVRASIPQLELAVGEEGAALILRHLTRLDDTDENKLRTFALNSGIFLYVQSGGPETIQLLCSPLTTPTPPAPLSYSLEQFDLTLRFAPTDFIQPHGRLNKKLVAAALEWMQPCKSETFLDLFCGLGNFSLPLARYARAVTGVEGSSVMTNRAEQNAFLNKIDNAKFYSANLEADISDESWAQLDYDGILLDPPRSGAASFLRQIDRFSPQRILYVSCNPITFASDAAILAQRGFVLSRVRVADMFPHTEHVETIGLFISRG
jgi:23S rRNA (uracil1939-C5)-methyltransferase